MDINYIRNKIYQPNKSYEESLKIQPGDYISKDVINMLKDAQTSIRLDCFAKADQKNPYVTEIICPRCKKDIIKYLNKTAIIEYLKDQNLERFLCEECEQEFKLEQKQKRNEQIDKIKKQKEINTKKYIDKYLDPNKSWDVNTTWRDRISVITNMYLLDEDVIASHIKQMSYSDFLKTLYWSAIAMHKKYKSSYKCSMCGSTENLSTHHNTYRNHGYEHRNNVINQDLIVLCQHCHDKFHISS